MDSVANYFKILMNERDKSRRIEAENSDRMSLYKEKLREYLKNVAINEIPKERYYDGSYRSPDYCASSEQEIRLDMQRKGENATKDTVRIESVLKCRALKNVVTDINRHGNPPPAKLVYDGRRYGYHSDVTCSAYFSWSLLSSASLIGDRVIGGIGDITGFSKKLNN